LWSLHTQNLHQPELIPALLAAEFYRIHALAYKVKSQPSRPDVFKRSPAHPFRIRRHTAVFEHDFKSIAGLSVDWHLNPAERSFDGPLSVSEVSMTDDICQRFVDSENHGAAFGLGKSQFRRELCQSISNHTEHLRIALQLHFEKQTSPTHVGALLGLEKPDSPLRLE
jgi:hypothetical protein